MKKICILTCILLSIIGCFSDRFDEVPNEGTCYLRLKVMCRKRISLEALIGDDIFTDTVIVDPIGDGIDTYKCLPVPCHMNSDRYEVSGDVVLLGRDIFSRPDHLERGSLPAAFTSQTDCVMNDTIHHFQVECEGEENIERNEQSFGVDVQQNWQNERDKLLKVECQNRKGFYRVRSEHSNSREDRHWEWSCRTLANSNFDDTYWTDYVNDWDKVMFFSCKANYIMCGTESYHSNGREDRRWKFRCCHAKSHFTRNCELSDFVNKYDKVMDFRLDGSKVITSAYSLHNNHHEDRVWKFGYCEYKYCQGT